jgi:hypothetical protein
VKEILDKLAFVNGDTFNAFADLLFRGRYDGQNRPWVRGTEFNGFHLSATVLVATFYQSNRRFGVFARLQKQDILLGVLAARLNSAQEFSGLVAAHWPNDQLQFARHDYLQGFPQFIITLSVSWLPCITTHLRSWMQLNSPATGSNGEKVRIPFAT